MIGDDRMTRGLWLLVEELIRWQQINATINAVGFLVVGAILAWCVIKIKRLERRGMGL